MLVYLFIIIFIIYGIFHFDIGAPKQPNLTDKCIYWGICVILSLLTAFSYRMGIDLIRYEVEFENDYKTISGINWAYLTSYGRYQPGWVLLNTFLKTFTSEAIYLKLIASLFINISLFNFISKKSDLKYSVVLLYLVTSYFFLNYEVIREGMAVACFLFAYDYLMNKQWKSYYIWAIIAFSLHSSAMIILILPFFLMIKIDKIPVWMIVALLIGLMFVGNTLFETIFSSLGESVYKDNMEYYLNHESYGLNSNKIRITNIIYKFYPLLLYLYLKYKGVHIAYGNWIIVSAAITVFSFIIVIFFRFNNFFNIFNYLVSIEFIRYLFEEKKFNRLKLSLFYCLFVLILSRAHLVEIGDSGVKGYWRYYPYTSVFSDEKVTEREIIFSNYKYID